MCRICVSLGLVRSIPESRFLVLFLACVFSLNPIFELLLGRGHTQGNAKKHDFGLASHPGRRKLQLHN